MRAQLSFQALPCRHAKNKAQHLARLRNLNSSQQVNGLSVYYGNDEPEGKACGAMRRRKNQ